MKEIIVTKMWRPEKKSTALEGTDDRALKWFPFPCMLGEPAHGSQWH